MVIPSMTTTETAVTRRSVEVQAKEHGKITFFFFGIESNALLTGMQDLWLTVQFYSGITFTHSLFESVLLLPNMRHCKNFMPFMVIIKQRYNDKAVVYMISFKSRLERPIVRYTSASCESEII